MTIYIADIVSTFLCNCMALIAVKLLDLIGQQSKNKAITFMLYLGAAVCSTLFIYYILDFMELVYEFCFEVIGDGIITSWPGV